MNNPRILTLLALFLGLSANAGAAEPCYPQERADEYILQFQIAADTFDGGLELCRTSTPLIKLFKTIDYLRDVRFSDELRPPFVPGLIQTGYYEYLKSRVRFINGPLAGCRGGSDLACAGGRGEMVVAKGFFELRTPLRASTLVHELRHLDGDYRHVPCTQGNEKGNARSCDQSFVQGGSYAVQIEYLARLFLFAKDISDGDRLAAKGLALYLAQNKLNATEFKGLKAVLLVEEETGGAFLYDGTHLREFKSKFLGATVTARDRAFVVMHGDRSKPAFVFDPYLATEIPSVETSLDPEIVGRTIVEYNKTWPAERRSSLSDTIRFGSAGEQALLFSEHIDIAGPAAIQSSAQTLPPVSRWIQDSPCMNEESPLMGRSTDGQIFAFTVQAGAVKSSKRLACTWPADARDFAKLGSLSLILLADGTLARQNQDQSMTSIPELVGKQFRQMVRLKEPFFPDFVQTESR